jgi:hypothetical protein
MNRFRSFKNCRRLSSTIVRKRNFTIKSPIKVQAVLFDLDGVSRV